MGWCLAWRLCTADLRSPGLEPDGSQVGTEASPADITGFHPGAQGGALGSGTGTGGGRLSVDRVGDAVREDSGKAMRPL